MIYLLLLGLFAAAVAGALLDMAAYDQLYRLYLNQRRAAYGPTLHPSDASHSAHKAWLESIEYKVARIPIPGFATAMYMRTLLFH